MGEGANQVSRDRPLTIHNHDQSADGAEGSGETEQLFARGSSRPAPI